MQTSQEPPDTAGRTGPPGKNPRFEAAYELAPSSQPSRSPVPFLFTSESVSEGHPDKVADQISDAILDAMLAVDPDSRVAVETLVTTGLVVLAGETRSKAIIEAPDIAREVIRDIGYTDPRLRFDAESCGILSAIHRQSLDIGRGVDRVDGDTRPMGAGDQGMMFGYACRETPELMPLAISLAHGLMRELAALRRMPDSPMPYLRPDSKGQVTIEYDEDDRTPRRVHTVVVSTQHDEDVDQDRIRSDVREHLLPRVIPAALLDDALTLHVNPTGRFVIGGPHGDTGLTGRKIIVDTYGGKGPHGGGAFSGKDASKVDRSAAYAARHVAKNLVAAELADEVVVQLSYAIGLADPVSIRVDSHGTGIVPDFILVDAVRELFRLQPASIIESLRLRQPIFRRTATYGHFGRSEFSWEELDRVEELRQFALAKA
jgi:S-adenosylmethionine synthetase